MFISFLFDWKFICEGSCYKLRHFIWPRACPQDHGRFLERNLEGIWKEPGRLIGRLTERLAESPVLISKNLFQVILKTFLWNWRFLVKVLDLNGKLKKRGETIRNVPNGKSVWHQPIYYSLPWVFLVEIEFSSRSNLDSWYFSLVFSICMPVSLGVSKYPFQKP